MSYTLIEDHTSPYRSPRSFFGWNGDPDGIVWHWWNWPSQAGSFESTINFFCSGSAGTSAHFIVSDKRVACIVSPSEAAWHSGSTEGNGRTIGVEIDPRLPGATLETCAELAADLERQFGSLTHYGHKDWSQTACPGDVYEKIPWLIQRTNEILGRAPAAGGGGMEAAIAWMEARAGRVTYSMDSRNGPHSYDCSSAVYYALQAAGINPVGKLGNTETMFQDLPAWGFVEVTPTGVNGDGQRVFPFQRGDIVIWGRRGASGGANGHTMIMVNDAEMTHCNAGHNTISTTDYNEIWQLNRCPWETVYRYVGGAPAHTDTKGDWFDMATRQDLAEVVNEVLHKDEGLIRQCVHRVLHEERFNREGTVNGNPVGGTTTIALEAAWAAANIGGVKAQIAKLDQQITDLKAQIQALKGGM
ncbi:peptidoglycan amidohydrolase family protein [Rothia koreensis]|uniref:peptidoglycan amidohydrolase family protein n=1 Tax=Rothia koreensis TaxID=592378 RepID=UPI0037C7D83B